MATFAALSGDKVENILVADTKEIAELVSGLTCVEYTSENSAVIGGTYDGSTFTNPITE
jgi:hypothetical protein